MDRVLFAILLASCAALLVLEHLGIQTTLSLEKRMKGDVKRESRFLAQYGQSVCTPVACLLVWRLDPANGARNAIVAGVAVGLASVICMTLKRVFGRVRPGKENSGQFLGPSWKHANYRESFPSSHSACAVALSATLSAMYPAAAVVLWPLALVCAGLRYVMDAHYPSDVLGGISLGYAVAWGAMTLAG